MHTDYDGIYIAGDLNVRIGNKPDFIECVDDISKRTAIDIDFKGHGEAILDLCFESKFCVVNGRIDPLNDDFTSAPNKGTAVVDYFLTSHDHLHNVRSFEVISMINVTDNIGIHALGKAPSKISDHSMLLMNVCVRVYDAIELHESERSDHRFQPDSSTQADPGAGGDRPVLSPRFKINNNVPDDFMSNVECRNCILNIIERISKSSVQINNVATEWFDVTNGVRQGDSLSPTLFSIIIYLNDLSTEVKDLNVGVPVADMCLSLLLYADDIVLFAPDEEKLQSMLNVVDKWCRTWGMEINSKKTQILHVRNYQRPRNTFQFSCGDSLLNYPDTYKYLGYMIQEHLCETKNVEIITACASRSFGKIHSIFKKMGNMGIQSYETLYESYVDPIINCASVSGDLTNLIPRRSYKIE